MNPVDLIIDTETHKFRPGNMCPKPVCLQWAIESSAGIVHHTDIEQRLGQLLQQPNYYRFIGHNIAYDMSCLLEHYPALGPAIWELYDNHLVVDTLVAERLLDIAIGDIPKSKSYSLAALAKEHLDRDMDKTEWRMDYADFADKPLDSWPAGARAYAIGDAVTTRDLWAKQQARVVDYPAFEQELARQTCYDFALRLTSARGMMVDQAHVAALLASYKPRQAELRMIAYKAGLLRANGTQNIKETRAAIATTYPGEPPTTDGGAISTNAETIARCDHPGLQAIAELSALDKIEGTYLMAYQQAGSNPVHASYSVLGARSGRVSCYEPNLENVPRAPGIRECFVARPGHVFVFCDFDSQEMRTWAQVCKKIVGRSALADRYAADPDYDPHTDFGARLQGIDYAEGLARKKAGDKTMLEFRQRAKAANFGFPGGMGAATMRTYAEGYGIKLTEAEAEALQQAWKNQYPEVLPYFAHISALCDQGPARVTLVASGRVRGDCGYTEAANSYFQGLAADCSKSALYDVTRKCFGEPGTSALAGARPVVFIHDEIGIEVPEEYAHEAAIELRDTMQSSMQALTPDVPARASATMMRRWSKAAKPYYYQGRLCPSEDRT